MDDDERVWWCACVEGGEAETNPRSYSTQVPLAACVRSLIKLTVIFFKCDDGEFNTRQAKPTQEGRPRRSVGGCRPRADRKHDKHKSSFLKSDLESAREFGRLEWWNDDDD